MKRARWLLSWAFLIPGLLLGMVALAFVFVADTIEPIDVSPILPAGRR